MNSRRRNVAACDLQIRLDAGADLNARSDTGTPPLHVAALVCQDPDAIKLLIKAGANIDAIDPSSGFTPLFFAARNSNRVATRVLLEAGAEASATLHDGRTPLHVAAEYAKEPPTFLVPADSTREAAEAAAGFLADWRDRFPSTVESLLRYGADPTALTNAGETACRLTNEWLRQSEILAMLCPKL